MKWSCATGFEYRFRYLIHAVIYTLGFSAPWERGWENIGHHSVWVELAGDLQKETNLGFSNAIEVVLFVAILFAVAGALFRLWGTAYLGSAVVQDSGLHADLMLADGPYRRTRNPLYFGTILHTLALSVLMRPIPAVLTIFLIVWLQYRLILREEHYLREKLGPQYLRFKAAVPRLLPSLRAKLPAGGRRPAWGQAALGEIYFLGVMVSFLVLGWQWDVLLILRGILIALGLSIMARAFLPKKA